MRCAELRRWLDQGREKADASRASAHAATCPACAALLRADEEIERLLEGPLALAPTGFAERVMARLPAQRVSMPFLVPPIPWWLRAMCDPAAVLALALAGLLSWRGGALWDAALVLGAASGTCLASLWSGASEAARLGVSFNGLSRPDVRLGLEIALACVLLLSAPALTRLGVRAASRATRSS